MSGALNVLRMKDDDVLKSFVAETLLGGTNLDFQMQQYIYESAGICITKLKRIRVGEAIAGSSCRCCH